MKPILEQIKKVFEDNQCDQEKIVPDYFREMDKTIETFFDQLDSYRRNNDKERTEIL